MIWPFKKRARPMERWTARAVRFVGEQDGPPERELKDCWIPILQKKPTVERAYLARVAFDNRDSTDIALAIYATSGFDAKLERELGTIFTKMFVNCHLDIIFLTAEQDAEARAVYLPFYPLGYCSYVCAADVPFGKS